MDHLHPLETTDFIKELLFAKAMVTQVAHLSKHPVILYFPIVSLTFCNDHRLKGL